MTDAPTLYNLMDLGLNEIEELVISLGYKAFHGRNLFKWIHKHGVIDYDAMTDLPKAMREKLALTACIKPPRIATAHPSADGTIKWLMELQDGQQVETVYIPEGKRSTICVSSQVGCALACNFCATGKQGYSRNLSVGEIIGQVWHAARHIGASPTNVVMMGMGEPLANMHAVLKAVGIMQDDLAYMLARQRITISTSGLVPQIESLREQTDVSLAVSLHAATDELRNQLMPINQRYPLARLIPSCKAYLKGDKRRKITWEYVMIDGVNDSIADAKHLINLLQGVPSKINLIPFNPCDGIDYQPSPAERIDAFRNRLIRSGFVTTVRRSRGDEIAAACGQLTGRVKNRSHRVPPRPVSMQVHIREH